MHFPEYHKSLDTLHFGTLAPRAYYIPYSDRATAVTTEREKSENFMLLSGEWKFRFFDTFEDLTQDVTLADFDFSQCDTIKVPRCWQMYTDRDYDKPLYSNLCYPFPTDPPHVPEENPCGVYMRDFDISVKQGERYYLNFEGVSSCFYLFINGKFVAYSQVSHQTSEIDVTDVIVDGTNRISVVVVKWCDGTYLEDQDFFRLSGIFRDVYILRRPEGHVFDIDVRTKLNADFSSCEISVALCAKGNYSLLTADGAQVADGEFDGDFSFTLNNPLLWNAEQPNLYTLLIESRGEIIPLKIGVRSVTIENKVLKLNDKRFVLKGINRHDSHPENGYAVTIDEMKRELHLIKAANCNAIRTSHYPNDPRFLQMCSELGIYLVDEADIETHGMGYDTREDWDWVRWSYLSSSPDWKDAYVDRAARLYERDKNAPCVVMWSLGNESGAGVNLRAMAQYIKARDNTAIIHYENSHKEFKVIPEGEDFSDISDVESRMYPSAEYTEQYLKDENNTKPFYLCEYVCSVTTGDVYDYFRFADEYDNFCGGCIWEFCDHAVNVPDENGNARYYYGGDFGDIPNDGICCIDGLVYPDRTPRPGYYDMKKVYEPFVGEYADGAVTIKNRRDFVSLDDLYIVWNVAADGEVLLEGTTAELDIAAGEAATVKLFDADFSDKENCFLTLSFRYAKNREWEKKDYEAGFLQFELGKPQSKPTMADGKVDVCETERYVTAQANGAKIVYDKTFGRLCAFEKNGFSYIKKNSAFDLWRAPTYNCGDYYEWIAHQFDRVRQKTYSTAVSAGENGEVVISTQLSLGAHSRPPVVRMTATWKFDGSGRLSVELDGTVKENAPFLPHLGLLLVMPKDFENVNYFGLGEIDTYPGRDKAARFGRFNISVTDMYEHYVRPQECGNRFNTRVMEITNGKASLRVTSFGVNSFSFKALHHSTQDISSAKHDFELKEADATYLNLDGRVTTLSRSAEFDKPQFSKVFAEKTFKFGFVMETE